MSEIFLAIVITIAVMDGDTMRVQAIVWPGVLIEERVRLLDVDAPEHRAASQCERDLAKKATEWMTQRTRAATRIVVNASKRDGFGRILGHIYLDGVSLGKEALAAGVVRPYSVKEAWC